MIFWYTLSLLLAGIPMLLVCVALPLERSQSNNVHPRLEGLRRGVNLNLELRKARGSTLEQRPSHTSVIAELHARQKDHQNRSVGKIETTYDTLSPLSRRGRGGSDQIIPGTAKFDLSTMQFTNFAVIVPAAIAAIYIEDFFNTIALRIETGYWADSAPSNYRVIRMWDFELTFYSLNSMIPWDFVQEYVLHTLDYVSNGFTGIYQEHMIGTINGAATAVSIGFRILNRD